MADSLFIDDSYSRTHAIAARPGLHPAVAVVYRPALPKERLVYSAALDSRNVDQIETYQSELVAKQVASLNGQPVNPVQARRLEPNVRSQLIDLILGYTPAQAEQDAGNSPGV